MDDPAGLDAFIQALPKTETHLHVEGALPYDELLRPLDPAAYPADPPFRRASYRYPSFPDFEATLLGHAIPWFNSTERYYEAARLIFANHVRQNVRYVETSFHLPATQILGVPGPEVIAAIRAAVPPGLEVRIFAGMKRDDYNGPLRRAIDALEDWDDLAGVDLHGYEPVPNQPWCAEIWRRCRAAGKVTKCHAGEFDGAHRVREAIAELGVRRVQHGVRAVEDPQVMALARDQGATFDVCPISNVRLQVFPAMEAHPIRRLLAAGIRCTVSTDDPLCFANSVNDEYRALAHGLAFTRAELAGLACNGWEVADVSPELRRRMLAEIGRVRDRP
ncbi:MAG TPA: adenosine deaminase [Opitutaceae bacterium]|nr:adenosine deaminase [Opitutaceae bacterium]